MPTGTERGGERPGQRLGIDLGSVAVKVVVLDPADTVVHAAYRRHQAEPQAALLTLLQDAARALGDAPVTVAVTGSVGLGLAERCGLTFVQEVIASAGYVQRFHPQVRTFFDIGGEDSKLVHFDERRTPDFRMNGSCAGGTGCYLDEMAGLLNVAVADLDALAAQATHTHPIASRCGVFGKTDVQNLLSRQVARGDIAASILQAVVLQTLTSLARGLELQPPVLLGGGPLTFIPALRRALLQALGWPPAAEAVAPRPELLAALGAALAAEGGPGERIAALVARLQAASVAAAAPPTLPPLFASDAARQAWLAARSAPRIDRVPLTDLAGQPCFLGVDSGSTTTKLVLVDEAGRVAFTRYAPNGGDAVAAALAGLRQLQHELTAGPRPPRLARTTATGYGEDLVRAAFGLDEGVVETRAHARAALAVDPAATFVLDIGGQDMKAIWLRDGAIVNLELNEACSSGCGTFLETLARGLGYSVAEFAELACRATQPYDLGSRCTVFMNSRLKQALKDGATIPDIAAGLAYAVVRNALYKVLRVTDPSTLGDHLVLQGGTFRNAAVQRAMELLLGRPTVSPNLAELMGAYGAALTARDAWQRAGRATSSTTDLAEAEARSRCDRRTLECGGCPNRCRVTRLAFAGGGRCHTGNRCERVFGQPGRRRRRESSLPERQLASLFDRPLRPATPPALVIGVPRAMNTYDDFPFWCALLVGCGFEVRLSAPSTPELYRAGAPTVMSDSLCFPAKLVHGHILNLVEQRVDRILYPMVVARPQEFAAAANTYNCPIVSGYADVVRSAIDPAGRHGVPLDSPAVTFQDEVLLRHACRRYLRGLGVGRRAFDQAFAAALAAQRAYREELVVAGDEVLRRARRDGTPVVLLLGRPYHLDPLVNHDVTETLLGLGVEVITQEAVPAEPDRPLPVSGSLTQWEAVNRCYHAADWASRQPAVAVVQLNSFGCGPDAFTLHEVKRILAQRGRRQTVVRIDEITSTGSVRLRLRSLLDSLATRPARSATSPPTRVCEVSDRGKTVLVAHFSPFCDPVVAGPVRSLGYPLETLPPPDRESLEIGLRYAPNEICYPGIVVIGDVLKALQSGRYDPHRVVIGFWLTGGQCRASNYLSLLRPALDAAGFADTPIVALTPSRDMYEQPGNDLSYRQYLPRALLAAAYSDAISAMYHACAVRAVNRRAARALAAALLEPLRSGAMVLQRPAVMASLAAAVEAFNRLPAHDETYPRVGLVGEIYVKHNPFANGDVVHWLADQGFEVVAPQFLNLFLPWFVNADVKVREHLARRDLAWLAARVFERRVQSVWDETEQILQGFRYHRPRHDIRSIARAAAEVMQLTHYYGEGWAIACEIGLLAEEGIGHVLCLQPFGCLANQVVAKGVARRLRERWPATTVTFLDVDVAHSEANRLNRLELFVAQARSQQRVDAEHR